MFLVLKFRELNISLAAFCRLYNIERTVIRRWAIKYDNKGVKGLKEILLIILSLKHNLKIGLESIKFMVIRL